MGKRGARSEINNLVIVSDMHCGSVLGLCPPRDIKRPEAQGGTYKPSPQQRLLWRQWCYAWQEFVPSATRGEPFAIAVNGDIMDGDHHNTSTIISRNLGVQAEVAAECMRIPLAVPGFCGALYGVGGTPAHAGEAWAEEERLYKDIGALEDEFGNRARGELWVMCGPMLGSVAHHIGTTSSGAYETSALAREANELYAEAAKRDIRPPDFVVRSHRHLRSEIDVAREGQDAIVTVTPGWQLKTPFVQKTAGGRIMTPQTGLIVMRYHEEQLFCRNVTWFTKRPRVEIPRGRA